MWKSTVAAVALLAATALTPVAHAADQGKLQVAHQTGYWATSIGLNDAGYPMCVTSTEGKIDNRAAAVMLKWDTHYPNVLLVHLVKLGWKVPDNQLLRVRLQVDNAPARIYNATASDGNLLEFSLDWDSVDPVTSEKATTLLSNLLRSGLTLHVSFPDYPGEMGWATPLNGSNAEIQQFAQCITGVITAVQEEQKKSAPASTGRSIPTYRQL